MIKKRLRMCDGSEFVVFYLDLVFFPTEQQQDCFKSCCFKGHVGVQGPQGINPSFKIKNLNKNKWNNN